MPSRIIKESIRTSKTVNAMSDFQFRLWVYLITYVDDYGRGSADPEILKGFVFPRRKRVSESDIEKTLAELAGMGCINLYEVDGESYFCFPNWGDHQRIQTKKSKYPEPIIIGSSRNSTVNHGDPPPESNPNPNTNIPLSPAREDIPPTVDEVREYCHERGYKINPKKFIATYAAKGWKIGSEPMTGWRAQVDRWEIEDAEKKKATCPLPSVSPSRRKPINQRGYSDEELGRIGVDLLDQEAGP